MSLIKCAGIALIFLLIQAVALPAFASVCRSYEGHEICILSIQRSAKNYWEYRAAVSVDGVKTPIELYNCRDRIKIQTDGTVVKFDDSDPGDLICSFFKK